MFNEVAGAQSAALLQKRQETAKSNEQSAKVTSNEQKVQPQKYTALFCIMFTLLDANH